MHGLTALPAWGGQVDSTQTTLIWTSMLPRVALEYGHVWCAASTRALPTSRSRPGRLTLRRARRTYPPSFVPRSTSASMARSAVPAAGGVGLRGVQHLVDRGHDRLLVENVSSGHLSVVSGHLNAGGGSKVTRAARNVLADVLLALPRRSRAL